MSRQKAVATMAAATIVSRAIGFARIIVVAAVLGTTAIGNTFQSTNAVSNVLFDLLAAGVLSAAIVPQLVRALNAGDKEFKKLMSSLSTLVVFGLGLIALVGIIFAEPIARMLFANAPTNTRAEQIEVGAKLLRFFMPQVVLYGLGALAVAGLIAKRKFIAQVVAPIAGSLFIMVVVVYFGYLYDGSLNLSNFEIYILALAGTGACVAFVSVPIASAIKNGISFKPSLDFKGGAAVLGSSLWAISIQAAAAILLGFAIFVGNATQGAVVAYQLAFVFFLAPYAIISQSFSTVLLPDISEQAIDEEDKAALKSTVANMVQWTYRPMSIATAFCIALSYPLTKLVSQGNASAGQNLVEYAFIGLVLGILPYSLYQALSRVYFAKSNIRLPSLVILFSTVFSCLAGYLISRTIEGQALAFLIGIVHTASYFFGALILLVLLSKDGYKVNPDKKTAFVLIISLLYGIGGYLITALFEFSNRFEDVLYLCCFTVISLALAYLLLPKKSKDQLVNFIRKLKYRSTKTSNQQ